MSDSPRYCRTCEGYGDHHTDRHTEMTAGRPTPAERLLRAAEVLESRASEAAQPWELDSDNHLGLLSIVTPAMIGPSIQTSSRYSFTGPNDVTTRYIATVHPGVGKQLAKVLRDEAHWSDLYDRAAMDYGVSQELLALADLVLADEQAAKS